MSTACRPTPRARRGDVVIVRLDPAVSHATWQAMRAAFEHEYADTGVKFLVLTHDSEADVARTVDLTRIAQHWLDAHLWTSEQMLDDEALDADTLGRCRDLCVRLGAIEP